MGDERLIEAFAPAGCPLCRQLDVAVGDYLGGILYEEVNDRDFRARFAATGGFCQRHLRHAAEVDRRRNATVLGIAILMRSLVNGASSALPSVGRGRFGRKQVRLGEPSACPACAQEVTITDTTAAHIAANATRDAGWRAAVTNGSWCVVHIGVLAAATIDADPGLDADFRRAQSARLVRLSNRLEGFIDNSSHHRLAQQTDDERQAVRDAEALLTGSRDR